MTLPVVEVRKRLNEIVPIILMFPDMMSEPVNYRPFVALLLAVRAGLGSRCLQELLSGRGTSEIKELQF